MELVPAPKEVPRPPPAAPNPVGLAAPKAVPVVPKPPVPVKRPAGFVLGSSSAEHSSGGGVSRPEATEGAGGGLSSRRPES